MSDITYTNDTIKRLLDIDSTFTFDAPEVAQDEGVLLIATQLVRHIAEAQFFGPNTSPIKQNALRKLLIATQEVERVIVATSEVG